MFKSVVNVDGREMYKNGKRPCDACKIPLSSMQICNVTVLVIVKSPLSVQPFQCSSAPFIVSFFDVELGVDPEEFVPPKECEQNVV